MGFETLTRVKITTHGKFSDRTDYFGLELEKVGIKFTQGKDTTLLYT